MHILGFDWDSVNTAKLAVHGLTPQDIEELFDQSPVFIRHSELKHRRIALGFLPEPDDRFVLVSFELNEETYWARVVTAFEPTNQKWWRTYAKAKRSKA